MDMKFGEGRFKSVAIYIDIEFIFCFYPYTPIGALLHLLL